MRLMVAGDLHLGRTSSRLPESADPARHTTLAAWRRIVDTAIQRRVDLLLLTGDVADKDNKFWQSIGPLREGVDRLAGAGVRTFAVAGNHDHAVLPRLADQLDPERFTLLGRGGRWEHAVVRRNGERLNLVGWSFPAERFTDRPLDTFTTTAATTTATTPSTVSDAPTLVMVHGDLDQRDSPYAPLDLAAMRATPGVDAWLLGHVHAPRRLTLGNSSNAPWALYPGSPQAMDPGEPDAHGVWLIDVAGSAVSAPVMLPISSVRYGAVSADLGGVEDQAGFDSAVLGTLEAARQAAARQGGEALDVFAARLTLTGRTPMSAKAPALIGALIDQLSLTGDGPSVCVEKVRNRVQPDIDLAREGAGRSPVALLARLVLRLDGAATDPDDGRDHAWMDELERDARAALRRLRTSATYTRLSDADDAVDDPTALLRDRAVALMGELIDQRTRAERGEAT